MTSRPEAKGSRTPEHPAEGGNYPLLSIHLHRIGGILRHPAKARNSILWMREIARAHESAWCCQDLCPASYPSHLPPCPLARHTRNLVTSPLSQACGDLILWACPGIQSSPNPNRASPRPDAGPLENLRKPQTGDMLAHLCKHLCEPCGKSFFTASCTSVTIA